MKTLTTTAAWSFGILFISVSLITTGSSEVVGPADPVVALVGDDVILPCSLKRSVSAEDMLVEWTRLNQTRLNQTRLNPKAEIVHLYRDGRDSYVDQFPSYRRRTSMFHEELKKGNISLKLTRVTVSDTGRYRCFIPTLTSEVKETTVQLIVGAVSQPVIFCFICICAVSQPVISDYLYSCGGAVFSQIVYSLYCVLCYVAVLSQYLVLILSQ
nr:butyrophilin-like protein 10 [Salvelinus alpinus]